jgi:hypothetical protein
MVKSSFVVTICHVMNRSFIFVRANFNLALYCLIKYVLFWTGFRGNLPYRSPNVTENPTVGTTIGKSCTIIEIRGTRNRLRSIHNRQFSPIQPQTISTHFLRHIALTSPYLYLPQLRVYHASW